jgi:GT2 family glycosyltransferase
MKFAVSVILSTYNRAAHLRHALSSLCELDQSKIGAWELIVVDNNSSDDTREVVEEYQRTFPATLRYLFCGSQGKSHAMNAGIAAAQAELLAFTDDDVTFDHQWLNSIQEAMAEPGVMGVGGRIVPIWDRPPPKWYSEDGRYRLMGVIVKYDLGPAGRPVDSTCPPLGANMAFRRAAFERHGMIRPDVGRFRRTMLYGEDTEFGRRLLAAGERIVYSPGAVVYHPVEPERLHKGYALRWYYYYGRSLARLDPPPPNSVRYLGVPRFLFRTLATNLLLWTASLMARRRFYYKTLAYLTWGSILESSVMHRNVNEDSSSRSR